MAFTEEQRKLAMERLRAKRERIELLESLIGSAEADELEILNGLIGTPSHNGAPVTPVPSAQKRQPGAPIRRGRVGRKAGSGSVEQLVRRAAKDLKTGISVQTVAAFMEEHNFRSSANRPTASIGTVFRKLEEEGTIRKVRPGSGRTPTIYELISDKEWADRAESSPHRNAEPSA